MTMIMPNAAPASADTAPLATADAAPQTDRSSTFGPALSEARERLAAPDARRANPTAEDGRSSPDSQGRSVDGAADPRSDVPTEALVDSAPAESGDAVLSDVAFLPDVAPDVVIEPPIDALAQIQAGTHDQLAPPATSMAVAATIHPTAKGEAGDGDPSIGLTIEAVAAPEPNEVGEEAARTVIDDGVTDVDLEAMTTGTVVASEPAVADLGRQAALTSLEQVSDANLELAERIRPAPTEEVAGPTVSADDMTRSDPFAEAMSDEEALAAPTQGRAEGTQLERSASEQRVVESGTGESDPRAVAATLADGEVTEVDAVDRPVQPSAIGTVNPTDAPDTVVVLAREAAAPTDATRAAATNQEPAPLPTAEANLWEDVRSAFDRIRATADGQEVRMRLRPAELGELLVQVRTQGEHVSVKLVASSAAAQQTLVDDRLRLAAELARAGFDEGSVDIGQSNAGDSGRGEQSGEHPDRSRSSLGGSIVADRTGSARDAFERRDPIRTDSGFRPGRTAQSTINLTL